MIRIIGSSIAILGLLLGVSPPAEAHGRVYHSYDSAGYHHGAFHRRRHMPRWLWNKRGFRHWYFRTPLRFNRHLGWRELYDTFRWERRLHNRRHYRSTFGPRQHGYDRDRRYWRDFEHRDRRPKQRRRYRNDD